jgi:hypothetical protein
MTGLVLKESLHNRWQPELARGVRAAAVRAELEDCIHSFELLGSTPSATDRVELAATTKVRGHAPRSFRDYVRDAASGC